MAAKPNREIGPVNGSESVPFSFRLSTVDTANLDPVLGFKTPDTARNYLPEVTVGEESAKPQGTRISEILSRSSVQTSNFLTFENDSGLRQEWLKSEKELTDGYLKSIPEFTRIRTEVTKLFDFEMQSVPVRLNDSLYFWKNNGLQNQSILCRSSDNGKTSSVILDPNKFSSDGSNAVSDVSVSGDGRYLRFQLLNAGRLPSGRFSTFDFVQHRYTDVDVKDWSEVGRLTAGTPRHPDPKPHVWAKTDFSESGSPTPSSHDVHYEKIDVADDRNRYLITNDKAPRHKLVAIDQVTGVFREIVPETEATLIDVKGVGGKLVTSSLKDACSQIEIRDRNGRLECTVQLPGKGTVTSLSGNDKSSEMFFGYTDFVTPETVYRCDVSTGAVDVHFKPKPPFDSNSYVTERVTAKSKDGTEVPSFIVHKKDLTLDGNNPTYLQGYGGFARCLTPEFDKENMQFLENGGIVVVANLRGGDEFGDKWYDGGRLANKQHTFEDFIATAEHLIDHGYTSNKKLAIGGRSNGSLLVGASMVKRPDLFAAAIPEVGVLDLERFAKMGSGVGKAWQCDYGDTTRKEDLETALSYSPLHNVKHTNYPATLVMTAENDQVVDPSHSYKFLAALQSKKQDNNPSLLYISPHSGHGAGKSTEQRIEESTIKWAFLKNVFRQK